MLTRYDVTRVEIAQKSEQPNSSKLQDLLLFLSEQAIEQNKR